MRACTLVWTLLLLPTAAHAIDEETVVAAALRDRPERAAIQRRSQAIGALAAQYVGLPDPSLRLTLTGIDPMFRQPPTAMLMAEQPIPLGDARPAGAQVATAQAQAIAAELPLLDAELAWQARTLFAAWRSLIARQRVLTAHIRMGDLIVLGLTRQMATGGVSAARLARLQAEVERLRVENESVAAAIPNVSKQLQLWLPLTPSDGPELELPPAPTPLNAPADDHPALARLAAEEAVALARVVAARTGAAVTLMPGAGLMTGPDMPIGLLVTVGLRWPGFGAGQARIDAQVDAAGLSRTAIAAEGAARRRRLATALAGAWSTMREVAVRRDGLRSKVLPLYERAIQAGMPAVAAGMGSALELAEAEHRLVEIELQLVGLDDAWLAARARWLWLRDGDPDAAAMGEPATLPNAAVPEPTPGGMPGM